MGLDRQIGQINSGTFGVFSATLSAPILVYTNALLITNCGSSFFVFGDLGCVIFFTFVLVCKARKARLLKNEHRLGYSEVQLVQTMIDGVNTLYAEDVALQKKQAEA